MRPHFCCRAFLVSSHCEFRMAQLSRGWLALLGRFRRKRAISKGLAFSNAGSSFSNHPLGWLCYGMAAPILQSPSSILHHPFPRSFTILSQLIHHSFFVHFLPSSFFIPPLAIPHQSSMNGMLFGPRQWAAMPHSHRSLNSSGIFGPSCRCQSSLANGVHRLAISPCCLPPFY